MVYSRFNPKRPLLVALSLSLCYACAPNAIPNNPSPQSSPHASDPSPSPTESPQPSPSNPSGTPPSATPGETPNTSVESPSPFSTLLTKDELSKIAYSPLVKANNQFGFDLFNKVTQEQTQENVFISPASASLALLMTYHGAANQTQEAMANTLKVTGIPQEEIKALSQLLLRQLNNPTEDIQLKVANSFWGRQGETFKEDFLDTARHAYDAEVQSVDFQSVEDLKKINQWVNDKTESLIPKLISEDPADHDNTLAALINAIYFKANWTYQFDKEFTRDRDFYLTDGSTKKHPMMKGFGKFKVYNAPDKDFQAIAMPYGKKGHLNMYVFLPAIDSDLSKLQKTLSHDTFADLLSQFYPDSGYVILPKFKLEYERSLREDLESLGMGIAFSNDADFSNMTQNKAMISKVLQKTFVEVNEEGTEAAAATVVEVTDISSSPQQLEFVVDRPFMFIIRDEQSGQNLFMGAIHDPQTGF